ncbi:MAG: hypothetical protein LC096_04375 [Bacteroidia bacterium]|nr:hypothetical protein [Bacteroidia bacterium]
MALNSGNTTFKEFSPGDATVALFGQECTGWKIIAYGTKQNATINKSGNNKGTSYSMGDEEDTCTLELYMSEIRKLEKRRKNETGEANIRGLKIPVSVNYFNDEQEEVTDNIFLVVLSQGREVATGADGLAKELETLCLGIEYDA